MQETVNIREYIDIFKRRKWIVIIAVLIGLILGGYKSYRNYVSYRPTYTSTVTIRINTMKTYEQKLEEQKNKKKKSSDDEDDLSDLYNTYSTGSELKNQNIATSYVGLVNKEPFRKKLAAISGFKVSELGSVVAKPSEDIPTFVDIKVVSSAPEIAQRVAQAAPEAYNQELIEIAKSDCVELVYDASTPVLIPRARDLSLVKYLAVSVVAAIFLVLLVECLDTRIKTPNDVDKYWDLPLIGVIPMDDERAKGTRHNKQN
ncbi:MAG: YveK family protein [Intestinibacter sp.]